MSVHQGCSQLSRQGSCMQRLKAIASPLTSNAHPIKQDLSLPATISGSDPLCEVILLIHTVHMQTFVLTGKLPRSRRHQGRTTMTLLCLLAFLSHSYSCFAITWLLIVLGYILD